MNTNTIRVGDTVKWNSQAAGISRTKKGEVIEVVPPQEYPKAKIKDLGRPRDHESYVIRARVIDGSESQKKRTKVYWPIASKLEKSDDQKES